MIFLLLLMGCSSSLPEKDIYVEKRPATTISKRKIYLAPSDYKKTRNTFQPSTTYAYPSAQEDVFSLLERNTRQVKRIYKESTRKISLKKETNPRLQKNEDCIKYCGEGYFYDRPGAKNNGQELVCTKYPLKCGYSCTRGWKFRYLVNNTNYTCQEAQQKEITSYTPEPIPMPSTHIQKATPLPQSKTSEATKAPQEKNKNISSPSSNEEKTALLLEEMKKGRDANHSLIKELLNSGANIHATDETGTSALIYALNSRFIKGIPPNKNGVPISNLWLYFGSIHAKNKDGSDAMKYSDFTFINELFKSKVHNWPSKTEEYLQKEKDFLNNAIAEDVQAYKFFKRKWLEEELERTQRSLEDDRYNKSLQKKWLELYQQELADFEKN